MVDKPVRFLGLNINSALLIAIVGALASIVYNAGQMTASIARTQSQLVSIERILQRQADNSASLATQAAVLSQKVRDLTAEIRVNRHRNQGSPQ
jgi:hypothetical protein